MLLFSAEKVFIDHTTRQKINNLLDDGDIHHISISHFLKLLEISWLLLRGIYYSGAPMTIHYLNMSTIDFTSSFNHNFESVNYFAEIFPL